MLQPVWLQLNCCENNWESTRIQLGETGWDVQ